MLTLGSLNSCHKRLITMATGDTSAAFSNPFYECRPSKIGIVATGLNLNDDVPADAIAQIKADVHRHGMVIFKNQGPISGERHVEMSKWFGPLESTFYKHPKSPHPDVFRVSNDRTQGCTNVGRTGWHIDGSFQRAPFAYSLYYMHSVPEKGATSFISLYDLISSLDAKRKSKWDRLWMISDSRSDVIHPLIYNHPVTERETLCFHLGMTDAFAVDYDAARHKAARVCDAEETDAILKEIHDEITSVQKAKIYHHHWEVGDFIFSDNLAVGHEATPDTQLPVAQVGLRVLHRTTIKGTVPPAKKRC